MKPETTGSTRNSLGLTQRRRRRGVSQRDLNRKFFSAFLCAPSAPPRYGSPFFRFPLSLDHFPFDPHGKTRAAASSASKARSAEHLLGPNIINSNHETRNHRFNTQLSRINVEAQRTQSNAEKNNCFCIGFNFSAELRALCVSAFRPFPRSEFHAPTPSQQRK